MARSKSRLRRKLLIGVLTAVVVAALGLAIWVVHLDRIVTREFQGRLWSVPAHVYAEPLELYVGAPVAADDLEEELRRLHYRPGDPLSGPGVYRRRGGLIDLHARRTRFADELREPDIVQIRASESAITDMHHGNGADLPAFAADPARYHLAFRNPSVLIYATTRGRAAGAACAP